MKKSNELQEAIQERLEEILIFEFFTPDEKIIEYFKNWIITT